MHLHGPNMVFAMGLRSTQIQVVEEQTIGLNAMVTWVSLCVYIYVYYIYIYIYYIYIHIYIYI